MPDNQLTPAEIEAAFRDRPEYAGLWNNYVSVQRVESRIEWGTEYLEALELLAAALADGQAVCSWDKKGVYWRSSCESYRGHDIALNPALWELKHCFRCGHRIAREGE